MTAQNYKNYIVHLTSPKTLIQREILQVKYTKIKIKKLMDGLKSILDMNEERHDKLKEARRKYLNFKWRGKKKWEEKSEMKQREECIIWIYIQLKCQKEITDKMEKSNIWRDNGWLFPKIAERQQIIGLIKILFNWIQDK